MTPCDDSRLCDEVAGARDGIAFHKIYGGDPATRVIAQSSNFALIADLSPLVLGHVMLVPKHHVINFGYCATSAHLQVELTAFRSFCERLVGSVFGAPTLLEHGSSSSMRPNACVTHAHWHLVPNADAAIAVFERDRLQGARIERWQDLAAFAHEDHPYIYYRAPSGDEIAYDVNLSKRHQYLRAVIAEMFAIDEPLWDWGVHIYKDRLRATVDVLSRAVESIGTA